MGAQSAFPNERPLAQVLDSMIGNVQEIIRSEVRLAKTEFQQEASKAAKAGVMVGAGAVFGLYAIGFLLLTCVYALAIPLAAWLAALIIGVITAIIAGGLVREGMLRMKLVNAAPEKTIESMKENIEWLKRRNR